MTPQDEIALIPCTQASAKLGLASGEIQNPNIKIENEKITKIAHLFLGSDMAWIKYFYSQLFNPEIEQDRPNIVLDKIRFAPELIQEIESTLESIKYEGFDIIKDGLVNWEVLSILREKFNNGKNFNALEAIITGFAILHKEGVYIEGKVNSESDFNENSFEKNKENRESLSLIQKLKNTIKRSIAVIVRGFSMSGVFEDGDVVGAKKVTRFSRYKEGDIIVFTNKDGERVIHMIVGFTYENGKKEYITWGVNNREVDNDPVARDKIVGRVVMSAKEQYNILTQARQGNILIIEAQGMAKMLKLPADWSDFISANNYEFYKKLIEFRGNDPVLGLSWTDLEGNKIGGGEGKIFISQINTKRCLKRWTESQFAKKFTDSVGLLERVKYIVDNDPILNQYIEVVKIHEQGKDWIERDYYEYSTELKKAIGKSHVASTTYTEVMNRLQELRIKYAILWTQYTLQEIQDFNKLYDKFNKQSFNLHWEDNLNRIIIIDMM